MSVVNDMLARANDDITFWKSKFVEEPDYADRLLDRLQLHLRERDHLLSLTQDERDKADEIAQELDRFEFLDPRPDDATMNAYAAIQDRLAAIVEVKA